MWMLHCIISPWAFQSPVQSRGAHPYPCISIMQQTERALWPISLRNFKERTVRSHSLNRICYILFPEFIKYIPRQLWCCILTHSITNTCTQYATSWTGSALGQALHGHLCETQGLEGHVANRQPQPLEQDMVQPLLSSQQGPGSSGQSG